MATMRQRRRRFNTIETTVVTLRLPASTVALLHRVPYSDVIRALRRYLNTPNKDTQ